MFDMLCEDLSKLPEVEALALGGSRSGTEYDEKSDYDLYVYVTAIPDASVRTRILEKCCRYMEIGNHFWELEDDCTLKNGIDIDIIYRDLAAFTASVAEVAEEYRADMGYTTCMWFNLDTCKIIFDRDGRLAEAKKRFHKPYPAALKRHIIEKNQILLHGMLSSYDVQIKKAMMRDDKPSVNHRTAAFLQSYFDIIFAVNDMLHPGEKRMIAYAKKSAKILPAHFEENLDELFRYLMSDYDRAFAVVEAMYRELVAMLEANV